MNPWAEILVLIIHTLASVYLMFVVLRFMLQLARADFYNQFSQAIVKVTNPLLLPLRRIIPGFWGIDLACVVLGLLLQLVVIEALLLIATGHLFNPLRVVAWGALGMLKLTTYIMFISLIVIVITSFVAPFSTHPVLTLIRQLMEPILRPVQRIIPPMGGLDFSVLFVFLGVNVLQRVIDILAFNLSTPVNLVIGYY